MKQLFALLVGIDDYPKSIPSLRGCVNDTIVMKQFLESRIDPGNGHINDKLKLKVLINQEATRESVIREFREHLGQAGPDDVALFCYSGHGSQEHAPEQFWKIEPDHLDETLVLYDSRSEGSWDLADKELAKLISLVAENGAHVVVLLDCCHSGSGTRAHDLASTAVRRAPTDIRQRPLESFLFADELVAAASTRDLAARPSGWNDTGRHVLLAACRDDEEAKEYQGDGMSRGAFSYFLGETLRTVGEGITYRALFDRAAARVRGQVQRQSPQLEASVADDLNRPFLGGAVRPVPPYLVATPRPGGWAINAGRIHGIPAPTPNTVTELALFPYVTSDQDLTDPSKAIAKARVSKVLGTTSDLEITDGAVEPAAAPLKAMLINASTPRLKVQLSGDAIGVDFARQELIPSLFVREVVGDEGADMRLISRQDQYLIAKPDDDRPLVEQLDGYTLSAARQAIERLEHIERWRTTADLDNPSSTISPDELKVEFTRGDGAFLNGSEFRMEYSCGEGGEWVNPTVTIKFRNTGRRTLHVALVDLPQTFGIFPLINHVGSQRLEPGQEVFANDGQPIDLTVPDDFWKRGMSEIKDIIKLIVSTVEFDARRLAQADLDLPRESRPEALRSVGVTGGENPSRTLERLMERIQTRHARIDSPMRVDDWRTLQFTFTTVRPLLASRIEPGKTAMLTEGVRVEAPPGLHVASARLTTMPTASRAVGALAPLPRLLYDDPVTSRPFELSVSRAVSGVLNVLELSGVSDPAAVTAGNPLTVTIPRPLGDGERVLPVAFDGEFYLPLGRSETLGSETKVILERLPQPDAAQSRSLGGSLRIVFQKVLGRFFSRAYPYPLLAVADFNDDLSVRYDPDLSAVRKRVANANRIALFVHGIMGDTREMASSLKRAGVGDRYDLVLTFDYENLHDPISDTARGLKDRLAAVGLKSGHGKMLDVFAHSMGGLVSRWFIERDGGNSVVSRLMMLGTPNDGSPWPAVKSWATTALAVGLNELGKLVWPASVLGGLVNATSFLDTTLEQMTPGSLFLKDLLGSPDPKIPYILIAGDTSAIHLTPEAEESRKTRLGRLLRRLWSDDTKYKAASLLFGGSDNDIAVSVASMKRLPDGRQYTVDVRSVACDHLSYFRHPTGLKAIAEVV